MEVTRSNPGAFKVIAAALKELDGKQVRAGWFESAKYEDGTLVAGIAALQEKGGVIQHPGGTPYKIGADGKAVFVTKAAGAGLPVTKAHSITIPPRPFMQPTVDRESNNWIKIMGEGAKAVVRGATTARDVLEALGLNAQEEIRRSISLVVSPPLKKATIAARLRKRADKKHVGLLDKPLEDTRTMWDTVQHTVEDDTAS
jgi:hypothetical protein